MAPPNYIESDIQSDTKYLDVSIHLTPHTLAHNRHRIAYPPLSQCRCLPVY